MFAAALCVSWTRSASDFSLNHALSVVSNKWDRLHVKQIWTRVLTQADFKTEAAGLIIVSAQWQTVREAVKPSRVACDIDDSLSPFECSTIKVILTGRVHLKMIILSSFTGAHVSPEWLSVFCRNTREDILWNIEQTLDHVDIHRLDWMWKNTQNNDSNMKS